MTTPCLPYKLVEVVEERRHVARVEGHYSDDEAKELAAIGQCDIESPYEFEVTAIAVIRSDNGEGFDNE